MPLWGVFLFRVVYGCRASRVAIEKRSGGATGCFELVLQPGPDSALHAATQWPEQRAEHPHPALRAYLPVPAHDRAFAVAAKVSAPEVRIIELVVREPSRCGRSNSVSSTSICVPALPMRARNRVPSPIGSGVSNSTLVMAGLNDGSLRESATVSNTCSTGAAMRT
jgi:hypothetical protein